MSDPEARSTGAGRIAGWLALLAVALGPRALALPSAVVDAVDFAGLTGVDTSLVVQATHVRPGDPLQPYPISASVRALYGLGFFDQVRAEAVPVDSGRVRVVFQLRERLPIRAVDFEGQDHLDGDALREHAALTVGQRVSPGALFRACRAVEKAYRDEGFARAAVASEVAPDSSGLGVAVCLRVSEGPRVKLRAIEFPGAAAVSADELRDAMELRPAGFLRKGRFSRERFEADAGRLLDHYRNHGFKDATVVPEEPVFSADGRDVTVRYRVTEGPQYRFAHPSWTGAAVLDSSALAAETLFRAGEPFDQSRIDNTVAAVNNLYTDRGYLTGLRIDPELQTEGDSVRVVFRVQEGEPSHVGEVRIVGNTSTREHVIRRELSLYPGVLLRRGQLLRSQRDVFATGFFEDVQVEFAPAEKPDEVDITFRVKEKSSVVATAGAGYSSQVGLTGFVEFGHNNLFGRGQSVSIKLEHGGRRDYYDLSFTEPWLFGRNISTGFDLYRTEAYREIYVAEGVTDNYWQRRIGGGVRLGFPWPLRFPDYSRLAFGYSYTDTRYRDYQDLPAGIFDLLDRSQGAVSRFFVSLSRNSTDNPFHPTLGTRTAWTNEFTGGLLGGRMAYYRCTLDHRQYFRPFWKPVLMLRWRAGAMGPYRSGGPLPPGELFRLGGTTGFDYLRGYHDFYVVPEENVSASGRFPGGNAVLGLTSEIQFPIVDPVHGVLFLDAGDTWRSGFDVSLRDLKFGVGAGVTLEIPMLGPIGFYYGYGTETGEWVSHFAFGAEQ
jgi:outer membrane protein insertion porin family